MRLKVLLSGTFLALSFILASALRLAQGVGSIGGPSWTRREPCCPAPPSRCRAHRARWEAIRRRRATRAAYQFILPGTYIVKAAIRASARRAAEHQREFDQTSRAD